MMLYLTPQRGRPPRHAGVSRIEDIEALFDDTFGGQETTAPARSGEARNELDM
jgi:hypothetical protein